MNIIPHNDDLGLEEYSEKLYNMGVDGVIVSDQDIFRDKQDCSSTSHTLSTKLVLQIMKL